MLLFFQINLKSPKIYEFLHVWWLCYAVLGQRVRVIICIPVNVFFQNPQSVFSSKVRGDRYLSFTVQNLDLLVYTLLAS